MKNTTAAAITAGRLAAGTTYTPIINQHAAAIPNRRKRRSRGDERRAAIRASQDDR